MEGKDAIIQKIIGDATAQADGIIAEAKKYADSLIEKAEKEASAKMKTVESQAEKNGIEYINRHLTVCGLDLKKAKLNAKMKLLDETYDEASDILKNLSATEYKKLITNMMDSAVADGDVATISKSDEKILTPAFFADYSKKKGIKVTLSKEFGNFKGGIILSGNGVDKNLTFEVELKLLREQTEGEIAKLLFKEV